MADFFRGLTDIGMTLDGDIMVGRDGDFQLVDGFEWLYREVNKRIRTDNPTWMFHNTIGASLSDFQGNPNTPEAARRIRQRIVHVLGKDNIAYPGELSVRVVPMDVDGILIIIYLDLAGNRVELSKNIYNYSNGIVQTMESSNTKYQPIPQEKKLVEVDTESAPRVPNIYQERIRQQ